MKHKSKKSNLVLVQLPLTQSPEKSYHLAQTYLNQIKPKKPDLIVFPEMWLGSPTSPSIADRKKLSLFYNQVLNNMKTWCRENQIGVYFTQLENQRKNFYNTAYFINSQGQIKTQYRKIHLFTYGGENKIYDSGDIHQISVDKSSQIGGAICYDLRFPELIRKIAIAGAKAIIAPAQWPSSRKDHWLSLLKARAIENQIYVVGVNTVGTKKNLHFSGDSVVFDPWGKKLMHLNHQRRWGTITIDLNQVDQIRARYPFFRERRIRS